MNPALNINQAQKVRDAVGRLSLMCEADKEREATANIKEDLSLLMDGVMAAIRRFYRSQKGFNLGKQVDYLMDCLEEASQLPGCEAIEALVISKEYIKYIPPAERPFLKLNALYPMIYSELIGEYSDFEHGLRIAIGKSPERTGNAFPERLKKLSELLEENDLKDEDDLQQFLYSFHLAFGLQDRLTDIIRRFRGSQGNENSHGYRMSYLFAVAKRETGASDDAAFNKELKEKIKERFKDSASKIDLKSLLRPICENGEKVLEVIPAPDTELEKIQAEVLRSLEPGIDTKDLENSNIAEQVKSWLQPKAESTHIFGTLFKGEDTLKAAFCFVIKGPDCAKSTLSDGACVTFDQISQDIYAIPTSDAWSRTTSATGLLRRFYVATRSADIGSPRCLCLTRELKKASCSVVQTKLNACQESGSL